MKERLFVIMAAVALLAAVTLPILSSTLIVSGGRAGVQQTSHEHVVRRGAGAVCQSDYLCGG